MTQVKIQKPTKEMLDSLQVSNWPVWEKEISRFSWHYDQKEHCYILEGEVKVETANGDFHIKAGDFVTFEAGLSCVWDINKPIRKHFAFE